MTPKIEERRELAGPRGEEVGDIGQLLIGAAGEWHPLYRSECIRGERFDLRFDLRDGAGVGEHGLDIADLVIGEIGADLVEERSLLGGGSITGASEQRRGFGFA